MISGLDVVGLLSLALRVRGWSKFLPREVKIAFGLVFLGLVALVAVCLAWHHYVTRPRWKKNSSPEVVLREFRDLGKHLGWACELVSEGKIELDNGLLVHALGKQMKAYMDAAKNAATGEKLKLIQLIRLCGERRAPEAMPALSNMSAILLISGSSQDSLAMATQRAIKSIRGGSTAPGKPLDKGDSSTANS